MNEHEAIREGIAQYLDMNTELDFDECLTHADYIVENFFDQIGKYTDDE